MIRIFNKFSKINAVTSIHFAAESSSDVTDTTSPIEFEPPITPGQFHRYSLDPSLLELKSRRKRAIYHSQNRGLRENNFVISSFGREKIPEMDETQIENVETLLLEDDPDLFDWLIKDKTPPTHVLENPAFKDLKQYVTDLPLRIRSGTFKI